MSQVISYEIYPHTKIMEMDKATLRKTKTNIKIYVKNPKEKNHGERYSIMTWRL